MKNREAWKRHWSHPHRKKEAATRIGIAAFLFLRLIPVYALEGYWIARVGEGFESLVMSEFRFGNDDSGSASQQVSESASQRVSGRAAERGLCSPTLRWKEAKDGAPVPKEFFRA